MTRPLEVSLHHLRGIARSSNEWEANFARSILRQAKNKNWRPSSRQQATIDRIIGEQLNEGADLVVIEDLD